VNLAGALCLETGHCQIVEDLRITAETTVKLFAGLERANPDKRLIHVIVDNAGTNRGQPLREWLARPDCRIRPIYLPSYAPNLNAIERLWKVMHQHVTPQPLLRKIPHLRRSDHALLQDHLATRLESHP
jgi:transposase